MATPKFQQTTSYNTDARIKNVFQTALKELGLVERAHFGDRPPEMQSVTAALWLWFARMGKEERVDWLAREFPKVIAFMRGEALPEITNEARPAPASPPPGQKGPRKSRNA